MPEAVDSASGIIGFRAGSFCLALLCKLTINPLFLVHDNFCVDIRCKNKYNRINSLRTVLLGKNGVIFYT